MSKAIAAGESCMNRLQVYLRQLAFACYEASVSDDPRVIGLCLALLIRGQTIICQTLSGPDARKSTLVRDNQ